MNVRILITDLVEVCKHLNASGTIVRVVASGSMYATLSTSDKQRRILAKSKFIWQMD